MGLPPPTPWDSKPPQNSLLKFSQSLQIQKVYSIASYLYHHFNLRNMLFKKESKRKYRYHVLFWKRKFLFVNSLLKVCDPSSVISLCINFSAYLLLIFSFCKYRYIMTSLDVCLLVY